MPKLNTTPANYNRITPDEKLVPIEQIIGHEVLIPEHLVEVVKKMQDLKNNKGQLIPDAVNKYITEMFTDIDLG